MSSLLRPYKNKNSNSNFLHKTEKVFFKSIYSLPDLSRQDIKLVKISESECSIFRSILWRKLEKKKKIINTVKISGYFLHFPIEIFNKNFKFSLFSNKNYIFILFVLLQKMYETQHNQHNCSFYPSFGLLRVKNLDELYQRHFHIPQKRRAVLVEFF